MWSFFWPNKAKTETDTKEAPYLPDEMWAIIFSNLDLWMILNIIQVCQPFQRIAEKSGLLAAYRIERRLSPGESSGYILFKYIENGMWDQIPKLYLSASMLERDTPVGLDMMTYINSKNSQKLCDLVFKTICKDFNIQPYTFDIIVDFISRKKSSSYQFFLFFPAAALNQTKFLEENPLPAPNQADAYTSREAIKFLLNITIKLNLIESFNILLKKHPWYTSGPPILYPSEHHRPLQLRVKDLHDIEPLILCARLNRLEMAKILIKSYKNSWQREHIFYALFFAARDGNADVIPLFAQNIPELFNPRMGNKILVQAFLSHSVSTLEKLMPYIPYMAEIIQSNDGTRFFNEYIKSNATEMVRFFITMGVNPSDETKQIMAGTNVDPEILKLVNDYINSKSITPTPGKKY